MIIFQVIKHDETSFLIPSISELKKDKGKEKFNLLHSLRKDLSDWVDCDLIKSLLTYKKLEESSDKAQRASSKFNNREQRNNDEHKLEKARKAPGNHWQSSESTKES